MALRDFLQENGIPFLFVLAPYKVSPNDAVSGTRDFANQNADEFLKILSENNINFIDMRTEIEKSRRDFYSFFYKTDHHWTAEAGLFACPIIARKVNEIAGTKIDDDFFAPKNFNFKVLEKSFLGSQGRTVTLANAQMEDIMFIAPKKDFDLHTEIYGTMSAIRIADGGYETFIFPNQIQTEKTAYIRAAYAMYLAGDTIEFIRNESAPNGYKILFMGDSFTDVVEPFFALSVKHFDSLDLRVFDGSFENFVRKNKPYDAAVMLLNASSVAGGIQKQTHTDLWDFK